MMNELRNVSVKVKLAGLIGIAVAGFVIFGMYADSTVSQAGVTGPYYKNIVKAKDVISDILPPPMYIVESYLIVMQLVDEIGQVIDPEPGSFERPPDTLKGAPRELIPGAYKLKDRLLLALDVDRLLAPEEVPVAEGESTE